METENLAGPVLNQESPEPEGQTGGHQIVAGRDRVEERGHGEQDHGDEEQSEDHGIIIPTSSADEPTEEDSVFIQHLMKPRRWDLKIPQMSPEVIQAARTVDGGRCMGAAAVGWIEGFRTAQWTVAEAIAGAIEEWAAGLESPKDWEEAINAAKDCARIAREHAQPEPPTVPFRETAETLNGFRTHSLVDGEAHVYLSTYCAHRKHKKCRLTCKDEDCLAPCVCQCHRERGEEES